MKTVLPERSLIIQERLDNIVKEILHVSEKKVAMIILFGSYARGDWVQDEYKKGHITYSYQSDLDIMLVMKKNKYAGLAGLSIEDKIEKRLERKSLRSPFDLWVTLVLESIKTVNSQLEKGHYFFSDIKKEGILLYDSGEFQLAEAKNLPWEERRQIAKEDYEYWFARGTGFFMGANFYFERGEYAISAFLLHQATESFYNAILLVFSGYKPKLHDIRKLGSISGNYNEELWQIFPHSSVEQRQCFRLLEQAYVEARYNKDYRITKEQLLYLIDRVEQLKTVTEKICLERINKETI
ncbi:MAG: HEPN domain-containing protein [Rickettsia endosymbiont of Pseudomimeciton antennatum]|nr:HEPN domain-containing protein [Rickettsia endosymbiont of Pseudomimeciton antennatum]MCC8398810.1 HEPN domain-containing protein [Rickettsia endosymbiont of Labidopullus appendiculatus]